MVSVAVVAGAMITWAIPSGATKAPPPPPAPTPTIYTVTALAVTPPGHLANDGAGGGEQVYCNAGDKATGGGYNEEGLSGNDVTEIYVTASVAANSPNPADPNNAIPDTGWIVEAFNNSPDTLYLYVYAQCMHAG
jgi:hypothetical protein